MRVLITGGYGFIGLNLAISLSSNSYDIKILDSMENSNIVTTFDDNGKFIRGSILDFDLLMEETKDVDIIVHLAARPGVQNSVDYPNSTFSVNCNGTFNCLEAARKNNVKRFIFASSGAVLGDVKPPFSEELAPKPMSPYGSSKLSGEMFCESYRKCYDLDTISLRFSNVYGSFSEHKDNLIPNAIRAGLSNNPLYIYGSGEQERDFTHVNDILQGIMMGIEGKLDPGVYQLARGESYTVNEVVNLIKRNLINKFNKDLEIIYKPPREGEPSEYLVDISKISNYGYSPVVSLDAGIEMTISSFKFTRSCWDL